MKKYFLFFAICFCFLGLVSCDFSTWFNNDGGTLSDPRITGFKIEALKNPMLTMDAVGYLSSNTISIALPYDVLDGNIPLVPTITYTKGVTISPDPDIAVSFRDPVFYYLSAADRSKTNDFKVVSSIDPNSMTFLRVADPFYVDPDGNEIPIDIYELARSETSINLVVSAYDYVTVENKRIGFKSIQYPYNSVVSSSIVYGHQMPYTTIISSKNGNYSKEYTLNLDRTTAIDTSLISLTASCRKIYEGTNVPAVNRDEYNEFLDRPLFSACGNITATNKFFFASRNEYLSTNCGGVSIAYIVISGYEMNIAKHKEMLAFDTTPYISFMYSDPFVMTITPIFDNLFNYPPIPIVIKYENPPFSFSGTFKRITASQSGSQEETVTSSRSFNKTITTTTTFVSKDYYKIDSITAVSISFCHYENVFLSSYGQSYEIADNTLTIHLRDHGGEKIFGIIAVFDIVAESGNSKTYFININE